jgi:hypothetical protein
MSFSVFLLLLNKLAMYILFKEFCYYYTLLMTNILYVTSIINILRYIQGLYVDNVTGFIFKSTKNTVHYNCK